MATSTTHTENPVLSRRVPANVDAVTKLAVRVRREFPAVTPTNVPVVTRRILELSNQLWDAEAEPRVMDSVQAIVRDVMTQVVADATSSLTRAAADIAPALLRSASPAVIQKPKPIVGIFRTSDVGLAAKQVVRMFAPGDGSWTYVMNAVAALVATAERLSTSGPEKRAFVLNVLQEIARTEGSAWCSPEAFDMATAFVDEAVDAYKNRFNLQQCAIEATGVLLSVASQTRCFGACH